MLPPISAVHHKAKIADAIACCDLISLLKWPISLPPRRASDHPNTTLTRTLTIFNRLARCVFLGLVPSLLPVAALVCRHIPCVPSVLCGFWCQHVHLGFLVQSKCRNS